MHIINSLSTIVFSNIVFSLITIYEKKDLNIFFKIILMVWWFISILTSKESFSYMRMRLIIILPGLDYTFHIL